MNFLLIGMMGSGKTTVAKKLASKLNFTLVDMDKEIELEQGCRIEQIFGYAGEEAFRDMETGYLEKLLLKDNIIVSCGGGVVLRDKNFNLMRKIGKIVYLYAPVEVLALRAKKNASRPLLQGNANDKLKLIYEQRRMLYEKADITIDSGALSVGAIVRKIIENYV